MRKINKIIIHCTATEPQYDIGTDEIRALHTMEKGVPITWCGIDTNGKGWNDIGYHRVIRRGGWIETGRKPDIQGAHTLGHNGDSIGIAMVGGGRGQGKPDCNFTFLQWNALVNEIFRAMREYDDPEIFGHRDFANKACPTFDVKAWWNGGI